MCGRKQWKMDCHVLVCSLGIFSSHSGVISAIHEAALKPVTMWLRNPPSDNSLYVSPNFGIRFLMFPLLFTPLPWIFPVFHLVFLPVSYFRSYILQG